jgi:SRSO17 transposase
MEAVMSVSDWTGGLIDWRGELSALKVRMGAVLGRRELRATGAAFLDGLLSDAERKTGWMLSEQAGHGAPYRVQSLLGRSRWDADRLRDLVRDYAFEALGDSDGVLVVDETGFVKKGEHSVGVARQYTGTAGRIENAQVGVFLCYASRHGSALIDRRLYLPASWAKDEARRARAAVPVDAAFSSKLAMAREMIAAALDAGAEAGAPCRFVLADALYGSDSSLRRMLEERAQAYVLAVRSNYTLRFLIREGLIQTDPAELAQDLPAEDWQPLAAGEGSKGMRLYDWACIRMPWSAPEGFARFLLFRRSRRQAGKYAFYFVFAPDQTSLAEMAGTAGLRWTIEEAFQRAKDDLGLDHCEARSWHGWHRHMTLVMLAAAFLAKLTAQWRNAAHKPNERSPTKRSTTEPLAA